MIWCGVRWQRWVKQLRSADYSNRCARHNSARSSWQCSDMGSSADTPRLFCISGTTLRISQERMPSSSFHVDIVVTDKTARPSLLFLCDGCLFLCEPVTSFCGLQCFILIFHRLSSTINSFSSDSSLMAKQGHIFQPSDWGNTGWRQKTSQIFQMLFGSLAFRGVRCPCWRQKPTH